MNSVKEWSGLFVSGIYLKDFTSCSYTNEGTGRNWFYIKTSSDENLI